MDGYRRIKGHDNLTRYWYISDELFFYEYRKYVHDIFENERYYSEVSSPTVGKKVSKKEYCNALEKCKAACENNIPNGEQKELVILTNDQWTALATFLLISTKYREGELNTWKELAEETEEDGITPKYKNAASNAEFWERQNAKIDFILGEIEERHRCYGD